MIRVLALGAALLMAASGAWAKTSDEWTRARWQKASDLHDQRCAQCHRLYEPQDYSEVEWTAWMRKMRRQADLTADEYKLLKSYTHALRRNDKFEFKADSAQPDKSSRPKRVIRPVGL